MELAVASLARLPAFRAALERGWSPDNVHGAAKIAELLAAIDADPEGFVARQDVEARGGPVRLPDGSAVPRLPGVVRWIWDDGFCGTLGLRWQPGSEALPAHVLGHVGFAVVPWRRGERLAARALGAILPAARSVGLSHVEATADEGNVASWRSIEWAGGVLVDRFAKPAAYGGGPARRYHVSTGQAAANTQ